MAGRIAVRFPILFAWRIQVFAALVAAAPAAAFAQSKPPALPADLNMASLRVNALSTLYEFDLSPEQLKLLRASARKNIDTQHRTAAKANAELAQAFKDFQAALLEAHDDEAIAKARNKVAELAADAELDDDIDPTDAALAQAPAICRQLQASQIAAFLASHADQVSDPLEMVLGALESIRDIREEAGGKSPASDAEINTLITQTAGTAGYLVYGTDDAKALEAQISTWLQSTSELGEKEFNAQHAKLDEAAKKMIGDVDPMVVLAHWLNFRIAELLSNPELPTAIDATLAAHATSK